MLSVVSSVALGATNGHDIGVFKRFQNIWPDINKAAFLPAGDELFVGMPEGLWQEITYFENECKRQTPWADYRKLLQLCYVFLKGAFYEELIFHTPGAMHHTRWMSNAIYSLKIFMFRDQMKLTTHHIAAVPKNIFIFVSFRIGRYWNEACLAKKAPLNDFNLLSLLHE